MPDRPPITAHASTGHVPGGQHAGVYERMARLNGMHGRRVAVVPPRRVWLRLLWGEKTEALLSAWVYDRSRGWLAEVSATVQAGDVMPAPGNAKSAPPPAGEG